MGGRQILRKSLKTGICFGLTSGVITILGLMVGLHSFVGSKLVITGGILTVAVADAFSDSLGIHIAEESEGIHNEKRNMGIDSYNLPLIICLCNNFHNSNPCV